jgi:ketosteroid isomerase-like protein
MGSDIAMIRKGFAAWSRGDLDSAVGAMDPGIEFFTSGVYPGLDPVYRGHDGFAEFFREFRGAWEDVSHEVEQIVEAAPQLFVVTGHFRAIARDGLIVEQPVGVVVTTSNGTITRMQSFQSREEALEAAGLPPEGPSG